MTRRAPRPAPAGGLAGAAALVAVVTAISRVSGFGREAVIAAVYGASRELDAYLVATGIPRRRAGSGFLPPQHPQHRERPPPWALSTGFLWVAPW